jgi:outer membrane protein OmpA-like peptidoglycan-associated protein
MNRYLAAPIVHCIFFGLLLPGATFGQDVTRAEDLIDQLEIKPEKEPQIRTRGIVINVPDANQGRASFNTIQFEYDSAVLTEDSTDQLIELGKALSHERLAGESFVIEGHADAHGDDQYNKELSFRRATTVKEFLVMESGVTEQRLEVVGFGEERPKTDDPFDAENRRVDVVNVKAGQ